MIGESWIIIKKLGQRENNWFKNHHTHICWNSWINCNPLRFDSDKISRTTVNIVIVKSIMTITTHLRSCKQKRTTTATTIIIIVIIIIISLWFFAFYCMHAQKDCIEIAELLLAMSARSLHSLFSCVVHIFDSFACLMNVSMDECKNRKHVDIM